MGGWVQVGSSTMSDGGMGVDESVMGEESQFMFVAGGNTIGA